MMPTLSHFHHPFEDQSSPELRRMDMYNRARREELDVMLYGVNPRHTVGYSSRKAKSNTSLISRALTGLRSAIGTSLVAAGNRIQPVS